MKRTTLIAAILAASATIPQVHATLSGEPDSPQPVDLNPIGRTFIEFSDWHRITASEADVLAESGRRNADRRVWERCATNDVRIVCPGGYVTRWLMFEDEKYGSGGQTPPPR